MRTDPQRNMPPEAAKIRRSKRQNKKNFDVYYKNHIKKEVTALTLLHLRYFCMAAKYQNISKAANDLMVSQPSLSKTIRTLENELGTQLFIRDGHKLKLTTDGRFLYDNVRHSLTILDNAVETLVSQNTVKKIRICINSGDLFIEEAIAEYHRLHEEVIFQIGSEDHMGSPHDPDSYDLAVYTAASDGNTLPSYIHPLLTERFGLCLPKNHPLAQGKTINMEDLRECSFLATDNYGLNYQLCREHGFTPHLVIVGQNLHTYLKMLEYNAGMTILPEITFASYIPDNCCYMPIEGLDKTRTIVIEETLPASAEHIRQFIEFCISMGQKKQAAFIKHTPPDL